MPWRLVAAAAFGQRRRPSWRATILRSHDASPAPPAGRPSLAVFFPAYNDSGTIASLVIRALTSQRALTADYEIIVVNDGSRATAPPRCSTSCAQPIPHSGSSTHAVNRGYGGALRSASRRPPRSWCSTPTATGSTTRRRCRRCWRRCGADVDFVNGLKIAARDPLHRIVIGRIYHHIVKRAVLAAGPRRGLRLPADPARGVRRSRLERNSGVICVEMVKKFQRAGFRVARCRCTTTPRPYGRSQFFNFRRIAAHRRRRAELWLALMVRPRARPAPVCVATPPVSRPPDA